MNRKAQRDVRRREAKGRNKVRIIPTGRGPFAGPLTDFDALVRKWMADHAAVARPMRECRRLWVDRLATMGQG